MTIRSILTPSERLIIPLDHCEDVSDVLKLLDKIGPYAGTYKVGLDLITAGYANTVTRHIRNVGAQQMYDGKFSDIPETVERAVKRVAEAGHHMFTIHANCGSKSLEAAAKVKGRSLMLAVTVLTSMNGTHLLELGYSNTSGGVVANPDLVTLPVTVEKMVVTAMHSGADGIVCSPKELGIVRRHTQDKIMTVVPGVRPTWAAKNDQERVMTPGEAIKAGATCVVIGRPITQAKDPVEAITRVLDEITEAQA